MSPGAAFAPATRIRAEDLPLQGIIGADSPDGTSESDQNHGCQIALRTCDRMGNPCDRGGAKVTISASQPMPDKYNNLLDRMQNMNNKPAKQQQARSQIESKQQA